MSMRSKMKRRMIAFTVSVLGLAVAATAAYIIREHILENQSKADLADGLAALDRGEYETALNDIGIYVNRHPKDAESLFAYAKAREHVSLPQYQNLQDAMIRLRTVLTLSPGHVGATHELLGLYEQVAYNTELQQLAQSRLQADPTDRVAMRSLTVALFRQGSKISPGTKKTGFQLAYDQAVALAKSDTTDINAQVMLMEILNRLNDGPAQLKKHLSVDLKSRGPDDVQYALLMSIGSKLLDDTDSAKSWLDKAVKGTVPDVATADLLLKQADTLGEFDLSLQLLSTKFNALHDAGLSVELAQRLWQSNRFGDVVDRFANLKATDSPELLAMRYLSLKSLKRDADAKSTIAMLADQADRKLEGAQEWLDVLKAAYPDNGVINDTDVIEACRKGLDDQPSNGVFEMYLADAYARTRQTDAAAQSWQSAAQDCPAWAAPYVQWSKFLIANGEWDPAKICASQAITRAPDNRDAHIALVTVQVKEMSADSLDDVLATLAKTETEYHDTDGKIRELRAEAYLISAKPDDAIKEINDALNSLPPLPQAALIDLASLSVKYKLGLESQCLAKSEKAHGMTPELALAMAVLKFQQHQSQDGQKLIADAKKAANDTDPLNWDLAMAHYLDVWATDQTLADKDRQAIQEQARQAWNDLAGRYDKNAMVQWQALGSPSMQSDRPDIKKILDRLSTQYGEQGVTMQMAQANYLLSGNPGKDDPDLINATVILRQIVRSDPGFLQAHLILGNCDIKLGNWSEAIDEFGTANSSDPSNPAVALQLAYLYDEHGNFPKAIDFCNQVMQLANATPDQRQQALEILAKEGQAANIASKVRDLAGADPHEHAKFLVELDFRNGDMADYDHDVHSLLVDPKTTPDDIALVADEFTQLGRISDADQTLNKLDGMKLEPGFKAFVMGQHLRRLGQFDAAIKQFRQALDPTESPNRAEAWYALIQTYLQQNQLSGAVDAANKGHAQLPNDKALSAFVKCAQNMNDNKTTAVPEASEILSEVLGHPDLEPGAEQAFNVLNPSRKQSPRTLADSVRDVADKNVQLLSIQLLSARLLRETGQTEAAATVYSRAVSQFPDDAAPAKFAAQCYAQLGRWSEALAAATEWQRRAPAGDRLNSDMFIVLCDKDSGNPNSATQVLKPYLEADATKNAQMLANSAAETRLYWIRAVPLIADHEQQKNWLNEVQPFVAADDADGQLAFLEAWHGVDKLINTADAMKNDQKDKDRLKAYVQTFGSRATAPQMLSVADMQGDDSDNDSAVTSYRRVLQLDPKSRIAQNNLASILLGQGQLDEALTLATQACSVPSDPNWPNFMQTKAAIQDKLSKYSEAMASLTDALKVDAKNLDCLLLLAHIQWENKDKNTGLQTLKTAEALIADPASLSPDTRTQLQTDQRELEDSTASTLDQGAQ